MKSLNILILLLSATGLFAQSPMEKMLKSVNESQKAKEIKSIPTEFLSGRIFITQKEIKYYFPAKNGRRRTEQTQTHIAANFYGRVEQNRVKMYQTKPDERLKCEPYTHCPVFSGSSKFVISRNPENATITESKDYNLSVSRSYMEQDFRWVKDKEKFVVTKKSDVSGTNNLEGINIEIKPYQPASSGNDTALPSLNPPYVVWITAGRTMNNLTEEPYADGVNLIWDDAREKLVPADSKTSLGIPYEFNTPERPERDGENYYQQMLLRDVKEFDRFLLNPSVSYGSSFLVTRYYKDDMAETKVTVLVTFNLSPDVELAPLEPIPEPELKPLDPIDEEIPLTPLEPVKD